MTDIVLLQRDQWPFRWDGTPSPATHPEETVYVHHVAGNGMHETPAAEAFRRLNEFAINDPNDDKIAIDYSLLVHRHTSGKMTVGVARGEFRPAATLDQNDVSKAIVLMGYFHPGHSLSEVPTRGDIDAIAFGIDYMRDVGWIVAKPNILGHRDNPLHPNATSCPGDFLYGQLPLIRQLVNGVNLCGGDYGKWPVWEKEPLRLTDPPMVGDRVKYFQSVLKHELGWDVVCDGWYGPITANFCRVFRVSQNLGDSKIVGWRTWNRIDVLARRGGF